jgi:hypothetical protein
MPLAVAAIAKVDSATGFHNLILILEMTADTVVLSMRNIY